MARRDRNASLAGLAALGALMYARSRKKEGSEGGEEEVKPVRTTTRADEDYDRFKPTEDQYGAFGEEPTGARTQGAVMPGDVAKSTLGQAKPAPAKPAAPAAPAAGAGRSTGIGGPTAAQMAQAAMGAGGGRGGVGGPRVGEREAYAASKQPMAADVRKADIAAEQKAMAERQKRLATPGSDAIEQDTDVLNPIPIPGIGRIKQAAQATSRALAPKGSSFSELTFLGKGPQKDITPPRQIGTAEKQLLEGPRSAERVGMKPPPKELPPASATAQDRMREMKMGRYRDDFDMPLKKGGKAKVKKRASGGMAKSSVSKRADGIAKRGKTRGKMY